MDILYAVEEKYLQAMDELHYGETPKALHLLKEIIASDDTYARAYYSIGVIYHHHLKDFKAAGYYYQTSLALDEWFPDLYEDYLKLLVCLRLHKTIEQISARAMEVPGVRLTKIYETLGLYEEQRLNFDVAKQHYQKAALIAVADKEHGTLQDHLKRVSGKLKHNQKMVYAYEGAE
jgi:Tfp pilus assembly protein PilF